MSAPVPTLDAVLCPDGETVRAYCGHCRADHFHGAKGIVDQSNPHRVAHCTVQGGPYAATGYVLRLGRLEYRA